MKGNEDEEQPHLSSSSAPLRWYERTASAVLGLAAAASGGVAVFVSQNQAGAAALVVVGAAFLLVSVQGTRLAKISGGGNAIEMSQANVHRVITRAKREDAEVSEGMMEAVAILHPSAGPLPSKEARQYEDVIHQALLRIGVTVTREPKIGDSSADFLVETAEGKSALVEVKRRSYGPLTLLDVKNATRQASAIAEGLDTAAGILVITNAPLSGSVQALNVERRDGKRPVEVISWNDERDDALLGRALVRVAR
jgi:hypothetical protein